MIRTIILSIITALALSGCAHDAYIAAVKAQSDAYAQAQVERYKAFAALANGADTTTRVALAFALNGGSGQGSGAPPVIAPPKDAWDYGMAVLDRVLWVAGVAYPAKMSRDVAIAQAQYGAQERASLYATMGGMSTSGVNAIRDVALGMAPSNVYTYTANAGRDANAGTGSFTSSQDTTSTNTNNGTFLPCPAGSVPGPMGGCVRL